MSNHDSTPREDSILRSLRRITRAIDLHSRQLASQFGLTGPQLVCLRAIRDHGPLTPSELAREVDLSHATITGIIDRLARRQYVSRRRSSKDRRRVAVALMPAGGSLLAEAPSPLQTRFAERLAALPEENQVVIDAMLEQIVRMMDAEGLDAAPLLTPGEVISGPGGQVEMVGEDGGSKTGDPPVALRVAGHDGESE